jgi:Protein of unknown function (DUF3822)
LEIRSQNVVTAPGFIPQSAGQCNLYLTVEPGRVGFLAVNQQGVAQLYGESSGESDDRDFGSSILLLVNHVIQEHQLILPWRNVFLSWNGLDATLIPKVLYSKEHATDYLKRLTKLHNDAEIRTDTWKRDQVVLIYSIWADLMHGIRDAFPDCFLVHHYTVLHQAWSTLPLLDNGKFVCMQVLTKRIILAVYDSRQLLYINQFHIEKSTDVLYFMSLLYDQFGLDQATTTCYMSGRVTPDSPVYRDLETFFAKVRFVKAQTTISTESFETGLDENLNFDLLHLAHFSFELI